MDKKKPSNSTYSLQMLQSRHFIQYGQPLGKKKQKQQHLNVP